uniref:PadR family transcriptional regulator n=1 Tax=Clostridium sp. 12(A) TaxID=1163671 RepID=UPI0004B79C2A|nr:PadR family transcriptional regulator [Clostridium sp. 12(A)]
MSLSHSILGFLSYGSMTGYELAKAFSSSIRFFWYAQASHIYLELNKLEKKEFVTCEIIVQTDKPSKKLYTITEEGKREFLSWLSKENNEFNKGSKNAFLMKVFFFRLPGSRREHCHVKGIYQGLRSIPRRAKRCPENYRTVRRTR